MDLSESYSLPIDLWLAKDLPPLRNKCVPYDFLKLQYIRNKMTAISPLAMRASACNSHVTNVTLKTIKKYIGANTKISIVTLAVNACSLIQTATINC